jgi:hypothetical protein
MQAIKKLQRPERSARLKDFARDRINQATVKNHKRAGFEPRPFRGAGCPACAKLRYWALQTAVCGTISVPQTNTKAATGAQHSKRSVS